MRPRKLAHPNPTSLFYGISGVTKSDMDRTREDNTPPDPRLNVLKCPLLSDISSVSASPPENWAASRAGSSQTMMAGSGKDSPLPSGPVSKTPANLRPLMPVAAKPPPNLAARGTIRQKAPTREMPITRRVYNAIALPVFPLRFSTPWLMLYSPINPALQPNQFCKST